MQRCEDERGQQHDRALAVAAAAKEVDGETAGEEFFGEADEEAGDEHSDDGAGVPAGIVDAGESQDVEHDDDGDADPHPPRAADRLAAEELLQPAERQREER